MKAAILFLAAALGCASPVPAQNSIQVRDGQNACDCSKPFELLDDFGWVDNCPNGYKDISPIEIPKCVQIGCSAKNYNIQCFAKPASTSTENDKPQGAKPSTPAKEPANPTSPDEQKTCDCSKPFELLDDFGWGDKCPNGYKDISLIEIPQCVQIGCSAKDYNAKCSNNNNDKPVPVESNCRASP